jgi:SAM-dependent methyltransferase
VEDSPDDGAAERWAVAGIPGGLVRVASHEARQVAGSFGADAARYDRTRPGYPAALVERIVRASPGTEVLEVGIGTGIAAAQLAETGCTVHGVDVDERMAALARRRGFTVDVADFATWEAAGRTFDMVLAAQAWHWVDPVAGAARAAAVLRPAGRLALLWNTFDPPPDVWEAVSAVYRRVLPEGTFGAISTGVEAYRNILERAAAGISSVPAFTEPEHWRQDWRRPYTRDEWLAQIPTFGGFSRFDPPVQGDLLEGIGAAIDDAGGGFTMGYAAVCLTAALREV